MSVLRKTVIAASALSCGIAAFGAAFEGVPRITASPAEIARLPLGTSIDLFEAAASLQPAAAADALSELDPLSKITPAIPAAAPSALPAAMPKATIAAASSSNGSQSKGESAEDQRQKLDGQFDGAGELPYEPEFTPPSAIGAGGVVKTPLPNPAKYYEQAYEEAVYQAGRQKIAQRSGVTFLKMTASLPTPLQGPHFSYSFDARGKDGKAFVVYVDFAPHWAVAAGQRYGSRSTTYEAPQGAKPKTSSQLSAPAAFAQVLRASPEKALSLARGGAPGLSSAVSFAVEPGKDGGASYFFYDDKGWQVAVDARTGKVSVLAQPEVKLGKKLDQLHAHLRRRIEAMRPHVSEGEIKAAAAEIAKYKGMPWSQSEYDGYRINAAESLRQKGATKEQMKEFERLLAKAPILGGRFNPWAGD